MTVEGDTNTPLITKLNTPNFFQTRRQFLWDFMFYEMLGTSNLYAPSKILTESNVLYWLNPAKLYFPDRTLKELDKIVLTQKTFNKIQKLPVQYCYDDGSKMNLTLKDIKPFFDLSNSVSGNWYKGQSRIDALYKIISNSELALDSKSKNLEFSGKFMVFGDNDPAKDLGLPMGNIETGDIKSKLRSNDPVHVMKAKANIERFVEDMRKLELDPAYLQSYFLIGNMYNIPKEVLELELKGGIGDKGNAADKARAAHVTYSLQPKGDDMINGIAMFFNDSTLYKMDWSHLPFMSVSEKDYSEIRNKDANTYEKLVTNGVTNESAADYLGYEDFEFKVSDDENTDAV